VSQGPGLFYGVMEAKGAYNRHARIPVGGAALAVPFLEKAARQITLDDQDRPVVIADYGSSQGKNSLVPIAIAIRNVRPRLHSDRPIFVFHVDQPSNDFNSLFDVLSSDPDRYSLDEPNVFPCAIGRSFYEQVLPSASVHLGWCSYAAVWLRRVPCLIPGHFFPAFSTGATRAAFHQQAAEDWVTFLSCRASEMRPGAGLVVVLPNLPKDGPRGFAKMMNDANALLQEMVDGGAITVEERAQMAVGGYMRSKDDLFAPFVAESRFQGLTIEDYEVSMLPDPAWADFERTGDKEAMAVKNALFFRAVFMPSLADSLTRVRSGDSEALGTFADRLQDGLARRLAIEPTPMDMSVQTIVFAKSG
jgi:SAM dependent carboxyl methyltransferase